MTFGLKDWQGDIPDPRNIEEHPEWFYAEGEAKRIPGPRYVDQETKRPWVWGPTVTIREVGEYVILEFLWDKSRSSLRSQYDHGSPGFAVWVAGKSVPNVFNTLDAALAGMVAFKYEDEVTAGYYFLNMIGASDE